MPARVVDASAVAAILFGEPDAGRLADSLEGCDLHAPSLMPYEVASVGRKKALAHPAQREAILAALERLQDLAVTLVDVDAPAIAGLALRESISVYDAAYVWVAGRLGLPLVSLDRHLLSAARRVPPLT
jgi:predicted nucleic acid-binding protein